MQRVVGIGIDGTSVSITIGKTVIPCIKASYGDNLDPQYLPSMGSQERGEKTRGTYKVNDAEITMSTVVFRTIFMPALPANGAGNVQLPIVVLRSHPELGDDSDLLERCSVMDIAASVENSSKAEEVPVKFSVGQIKHTDRRVSINALDGVTQGTASL